MKKTYLKIITICTFYLLLSCQKENPISVEQKPLFPLPVLITSPLADSVSALDSIYIEPSCANDIYNNLIKKVQIYADNSLLCEYSTPPLGYWWKFSRMQDNTIHSVYVIVYDSLNRSGQSKSKTITTHVSPPPPTVVYTPYLSIGNKWYYSYHSTNGNSYFDSTNQYVTKTTSKSGFVIRQVIDTSSDGWHRIAVTSVVNGSTSIDTEYWKNQGGSIYIVSQPVQTLKYYVPNYVSSLTQDSSSSDYAWKIRSSNVLGTTRPVQYRYYSPYLHNAGRQDIAGISDGIGFVFSSSYYWMSGSSSTDTTSLVGALLGGKLYGDTTTIH